MVTCVRKDTLRLFEDYPAVQSRLQLLHQNPGFLHRPLLEDPDGRYVGHGLRRHQFVLTESPRCYTKQVQRPDHLALATQSQSVHRVKTGRQRFHCE